MTTAHDSRIARADTTTGRFALAAVLAATLLVAGPAHARVETPPAGGGAGAVAAITSVDALTVAIPVLTTRLAGLQGVHVDGGWLLR